VTAEEGDNTLILFFYSFV